MKTVRLRKAIAMIELIFAIVIMGIVLMSAPTLISQAATSSIAVAQQEAIAAASSDIAMVLTRYWDEQETNASIQSPILVVSAEGDARLAESPLADGNGTGRRAGTPVESYRKFLASTALRLAATNENNFTAEADQDDFDDFDGNVATVAMPNTGDKTSTHVGDYIDDSLSMTSTVNYVSDGADYANSPLTFSFSPAAINNTTNIKAISTRVTSAERQDTLKTDITLRAFSCNIGTYILEERSF